MNCGTAMEISVVCKLPVLMDTEGFQQILKSIRLIGEPISDGLIRLSNKDRIGYTGTELNFLFKIL